MEDPMLMGLDPYEESTEFTGNNDDNDRSNPTVPNSDDPTMTDPTMADVLTKTRRVQPKLTSDILLSERGLPYLVKHGPKRLRISTRRNKPYENLSRIVQFYQLWAHELYPRAKFKDFVKLCQNMKNDKAVRSYRTELCLREMNPSRFMGLDGNEDDNGVLQESGEIGGPSRTEKESERPGERAGSAETGAQQEEEALDTQEDEDAVEAMKELGF